MREKGNVALIVVLVVAAAAIAWFVFSGPDETPAEVTQEAFNGAAGELEEGVNEVSQNVREGAQVARDQLTEARLEARENLLGIQADFEENENFSEAATEVGEVRQDLEEAYQGVSPDLQDEWNELNLAFDDVEASLRENSADALDGLNELIAEFEQEVRTNEDG